MRNRAWRRHQTARYKAKQMRDIRGSHGGPHYEIAFLSDTRHYFDCGHRCMMCHAEKLIVGRRRERYAARAEIAAQL